MLLTLLSDVIDARDALDDVLDDVCGCRGNLLVVDAHVDHKTLHRQLLKQLERLEKLLRFLNIYQTVNCI